MEPLAPFSAWIESTGERFPAPANQPLLASAQLAGVVRWPSLKQPPRSLTDDRG